MEKLIFKYLSNKLTRDEKLELKRWLDEDPNNVRLFRNFVNHWNLTGFDVELMKHKIWQRLPKDGAHVTGILRYHSYVKSLLRLAAAIILIGGLSYLFTSIGSKDSFITHGSTEIVEKNTSKGQKLTLKLPDGTTVKLNADSRLEFPEKFGKNRREVKLIGEAFFDVVRNESKPFVIQSGDLNVKVLGTSFNINAYPDDEEVSVTVRSGKVAVNNHSQTIETILTRKERLVFSDSDGSFRKEFVKDEQMAYGWIDNYLSFNDLELKDAMELVSKWFDVEYRIYHQEKFNKVITAKFNNPTLKNVMENLSYSYEFKYEINGNEIMIK